MNHFTLLCIKCHLPSVRAFQLPVPVLLKFIIIIILTVHNTFANSEIVPFTQTVNEMRIYEAGFDMELSQMNITRMSEDTRNSKADFRTKIPQMKNDITQLFNEIRNSEAIVKVDLIYVENKLTRMSEEARGSHADFRMKLSQLNNRTFGSNSACCPVWRFMAGQISLPKEAYFCIQISTRLSGNVKSESYPCSEMTVYLLM
ncbi:uncharacterized protein [Heterodontus francisci]|uniref:uncharacterized protein n=1 Tax=Heterodontus francisci TaxID=7792 RepID=UPI00355B7908